ncbi:MULTISPECIES: hypothetical protein [unclassified Pseudodesulfovibrio]|uniref:hypothetical protein n=1 Tax=unclassified Pseudodesulfovibrio TaxID=2661612 RepID=UPI000FEB8C50|nr:MULTISPECIES: hypothetical protein [unclassified Pseudodesulfovibrio]MCJ2164395.1 hypothetical protein [Pseudodesulfovibrio sp. S3-i]RWU04602.1 hypothetical protein DWB63_07555 [Pseudodesulfovibrio sp. S3]
MTDSYNESFDWNEVVDLFGIQESSEMLEQDRDKFLEKINSLTDRFGRDYVLKKIVLQNTH